jgi:hypothetical protein
VLVRNVAAGWHQRREPAVAFVELDQVLAVAEEIAQIASRDQGVMKVLMVATPLIVHSVECIGRCGFRKASRLSLSKQVSGRLEGALRELQSQAAELLRRAPGNHVPADFPGVSAECFAMDLGTS